jgi:hypothetical protein
VATACGPGKLVRHGKVNDDFVAAVKARLAAVRHLEFTRPVPTRALGPAEIAAAVDADLKRTFPPADRERTEATYALVGLVPQGTHLEPAMQRMLASQLAAFYDPHAKELAVATRVVGAGSVGTRFAGAVTGRDLVGELVVAHELTHALQDQHWGLPGDAEPATASNTDRLLARRALLEGDATWASFATVSGGTLDEATRARVLRQINGLPAELQASLPDVPPLLRDTLAFQYQAGTIFVDRLLARGDWAAVDRAQADPPVSTEQVLHPERYLAATRDTPTPITLRATPALERAGYRLVLADTLGEQIVRTLVGSVLSPEQAARVADGWDGDRLVAFARGTDLVVAWMTAWDSKADAIEFADAIPQVMAEASVERRGTRVLLLRGGAPPGTATQLWAVSGQAKASAGLGHHGSLALELREMRAHGESRRPHEAGMQIGVDACDEGRDLRRTVPERIHDLPLTQQPMREVLVEERTRLLDRRAVSGKDGGDVERPQPAQRVQVGGHVAVRRRDDRRAGGEHRVAGEQPPAVGLVQAAVAGLVSRRVHDDETSARPGNLVPVFELRRRRKRASGEREGGAAAMDGDRTIEIERPAHVIGVDVGEDQSRDRDPLVRQPAAVLRVERRDVELDGVAFAEQILVRSGPGHETGIRREHHAQAGSQLHRQSSRPLSSSSRARRTSARSLA